MSRTQDKLAVVGVSYPFRGGIAHYSTLLVRHLRQSYEVDFLTLSRQYPSLLFPGKTQYDASANAIREPHAAVIDSINPWTWWRTARYLNRTRPRLIVFNWWHPFFGMAYGSIVALLTPKMRRRVCFLCHNVHPHERHLLERILCAYAFLGVRNFIVHSEEDRRRLLTLKPDACTRRNGHPVYSQFSAGPRLDKASARARLGLPADGKVVLFFGLIRPYKGLMHLLDAMPLVRRQVDATLLVAGEFYDDKGKYTARVASHGMTDQVIFKDQYIPNEEVGIYFAAADVVVLPYIEASQSGIIPIAYDFATPVITTRVGGLPEAVVEGETGLLVDPGQPEALAKAIVRYYAEGCEPRFSNAIRARVGSLSADEEVAHIEEFMRITNAT
jgi:glycosyltransferase involved in cell wall biosynthesis